MASITVTDREAFKKKLRFESKSASGIIDIEYTADGRLSFNGDVREFALYGGASAGQCQDFMLEQFPESKRLHEIWERWHLNDMRAACEHQRNGGEAWDPSKVLNITKYKMKYKVLQKQNELKERAMADAQMSRSEKSSFNKRERDILAAPYTIELPTHVLPNSAIYEFAELKEVKAGWTYPKDHPGGILTKPCDVCGYKYGSSWLFEAVPSSVLDELRAM